MKKNLLFTLAGDKLVPTPYRSDFEGLMHDYHKQGSVYGLGNQGHRDVNPSSVLAFFPKAHALVVPKPD